MTRTVFLANLAGERVGTVGDVVSTMRLSANCVLMGERVFILEKLQEIYTPEVMNMHQGTEEAR